MFRNHNEIFFHLPDDVWPHILLYVNRKTVLEKWSVINKRFAKIAEQTLHLTIPDLILTAVNNPLYAAFYFRLIDRVLPQQQFPAIRPMDWVLAWEIIAFALKTHDIHLCNREALQNVCDFVAQFVDLKSPENKRWKNLYISLSLIILILTKESDRAVYLQKISDFFAAVEDTIFFNLSGARLAGIQLKNVSLSGCFLTGIDFRDAMFRNVWGTFFAIHHNDVELIQPYPKQLIRPHVLYLPRMCNSSILLWLWDKYNQVPKNQKKYLMQIIQNINNNPNKMNETHPVELNQMKVGAAYEKLEKLIFEARSKPNKNKNQKLNPMAEHLFQSGKIDEALICLNKYYLLDESSLLTGKTRADILGYHKQSYHEAIELYQWILSQYDDMGSKLNDVYRSIAVMYLFLGNARYAEWYLGMIFEQYPYQLERFAYLRAMELFILKEDNRAEENLKKAEAVFDKNEPDYFAKRCFFYLVMAQFFIQRYEFDRAREYLEKEQLTRAIPEQISLQKSLKALLIEKKMQCLDVVVNVPRLGLFNETNHNTSQVSDENQCLKFNPTYDSKRFSK